MRLMTTNFCSEDQTVITASSVDSNFPVANLKHQFRSKRWRSTGVTSEWVVFDLQTTESIDSVVFLWPKEDGITLSNTAVVKIQANATNVWTSPAVDQTLTIDNTYVLASHFFSTDQNYRYWRVVIQDAGNPNGYVELGVVWLGKGLSIPNAQNGFKFELQDTSVHTQTAFGHDYTDEYPQVATLTFQYKTMDYSDIQTLENAFRQNGTRLPVLVALDPLAGVFNANHFTVYGKMGPSIPLNHIMYNIMDTSALTVTELS